MDNLDEILISKSKKKINYVNKKGYELIEDIYFDVLDKYINDNNQNNYLSSKILIEKSDFDESIQSKKSVNEIEIITDLIQSQKIFKLWDKSAEK